LNPGFDLGYLLCRNPAHLHCRAIALVLQGASSFTAASIAIGGAVLDFAAEEPAPRQWMRTL